MPRAPFKWLRRPANWARYQPPAAYLGLSLLVFLPLLKPGYIQTFDMPWGPRILQTNATNNDWLLYHLLQVAAYVIGSMVVEKLLLVGLLVLAGWGAHRLVANHVRSRPGTATAYLAGTLYAFNPFLYSRLLAGQWLVLAGYALLPWAVASLWRLMQRPGLKTALGAFGWTVAVGLTSIHTVGFLALAAVVLFVAAGRRGLAGRLRWCASALVGWIVVDAVWLVPVLLGKSHTALEVAGFGPSQLHAFATSGSVLGSVPLSTVLLQGFWADLQGRYYLPSHLGWWWGIVAGVLGSLIVLGLVNVIRRRDRLGISLAVLAVIAWWLGMGIGCSWSAGTTRFLIAHLPFYKGYREPEKWLMLLALAYAYFAAAGAAWVLRWTRQRKPSFEPTALYAMLLLPILLTPMLLWGAGGQLRSAEYPTGWSQVAQTLDADPSNYRVLVLPWHLYLPVSFVGRVVANPASHYFKQNLVVSDNAELAGVPPSQMSALYRQIDNVLLPERNVRTDASAQLAPYNVKYVILLHESDWQSYGWLARQTGLHQVQRTPSISLYEVR